MKRLVGVLVASLVLVACDGESEESPTPDSGLLDIVSQAFEELPAVEQIDKSDDTWRVELDPEADPLVIHETSYEIWDIANAQLTEGPDVTIAVGETEAEVGIAGAGAPPQAPAMGYAVVVPELTGVESFEIDENRVRIQLMPDEDVAAVVEELFDGPAQDFQNTSCFLSIEDQDTGLYEASLDPGSLRSWVDFDTARDVAEEAGATVNEIAVAHKTTISLAYTISDVEQGNAMAARLQRHLPDATVSMQVEGGPRFSGTPEELLEHMSSGSELADLVAGTGATLEWSSAERDSFDITVPDTASLRELNQLLGSEQWTPGPEASVSITLPGQSNSSGMLAQQWHRHGDILSDAYDAGLVQTRMTRGTGGQRERSFDISFTNSDGIDITTADGYDRIIEVMRSHEWPGEAQFSLAEGDHLLFWSETTGEAKDAYFALHGAESKEPSGWALEFLDAWNATAN